MQTNDKRERILDAAERVFLERGSARASTKRIAIAAGVAEGTLYLYFENKYDLLYHVFARALERAESRIAEVVRPDRPAEANLVALAGVSYEIICEKARLRMLFDRELALLPDAARERLRAAYDRLRARTVAVFDWGKGRGELRGDLDARLMAHALMAILERAGLMLEPSSIFGPADPDEARRLAAAIVETAPRLLLHGVAARAGSG